MSGASFTMRLKDVFEITGGTVEIGEDGISRLTGGNIGLNYIEVHTPGDKEILIGKIYDHYMNREIGMETIDMFQLAMRRKFNEIMPIYNQLYASLEVTYGPLSSVDLTSVSTGNTNQASTNNGTGSADTTSTSGSRAVNSDTPQTQLSGNEDYASSASDINAVTTVNSATTEDGTSSTDVNSDNTSHTTGYQGVAADLMIRYRESLINIDLDIINSIEDCFMAIWDNSDSFTNNNERLF